MMKLLRRGAERISARGTPCRMDGGFTLTELVVTIAIAGILATLAIPSFNNIIATEHAKAAASQLYTSLFTARSEAIRLDQQVKMTQGTGGWQYGWSTAAAVSGTTVDTQGAMTGVTLQEGSGATTVTYYPSGRLAPSTTPTFVITAKTGSSTSTQCVSIDPTGTPYMQAGSTC
jgi:type IV fimbrial biogenesis protein FimT